MVVNKKIHVKDNFIHVKFKGEYTPNVLFDSNKIKNTCKKYKCKKILLDCSDLKFNLTTLNKLFIGENLAKIYPMIEGFKVASVEKENNLDSFVENVAVNRLCNYRKFTDIDNAIQWLSED